MDKLDTNVEIGVEKFIKKWENIEDICDKSDETRDFSADAKGVKFTFIKLCVFWI